MVAGTFNVVIAQRLARRNCTNCSTYVDIKSDPRWEYAKKAFMNFDKDILRKELAER
jgi:type II secretory ATPase GspE/PulE/Tfp pilus assembly ATPase PilB-like protein